MRFQEFKLFEAKGIFGRMPGDAYVHSNGIEAFFVQSIAYPGAPKGTYETPEQRDLAIAELEKKLDGKIEWVNQPRNNLAFGIAELQTSDGDRIYWGRYLQTSVGVLTTKWKNNEIPAGWTLNIKSAKKLQVGYDPQKLIKTDNKFNSVEAVIEVVKRNAVDKENGELLVQSLNNLKEGQLPVFTNMAPLMSALRDYFGEIMTPVALTSGIIGGDAEKARKLLVNDSWASCEISWPQAMNNNLIDSVFTTKEGLEIGISSKGGTGAKASIKNIYDAIEKARKENSTLIKKYKNVIDIIDLINQETAVTGPLKLGQQFGIINETQAEDIVTLIQSGTKVVPKQYANMVTNYKAVTTHQNYNAGLHVLSSLAKHCADRINALPNTSKALSSFMNQATIIQIYLDMKTKSQDAVVSGFRSLYPPNFQGKLVVSADKSYYSTQPPSKFVFSWKAN